MNLALFYDTETTGLPLWREPSDHPDQPHIVQLAAALVDLDTRRTVGSLDVIVRPEGWTIPEDMTAIHGISTELARDVGVSEGAALSMLLDLWNGHKRIGHNQPFDARIIRIAQHRAGFAEGELEKWKSGTAECTQRLATSIMRIGKTTNLREAHEHFLGRPLENAHSAMADVQGCMAVYFAIQDYQATAQAAA